MGATEVSQMITTGMLDKKNDAKWLAVKISNQAADMDLVITKELRAWQNARPVQSD